MKSILLAVVLAAAATVPSLARTPVNDLHRGRTHAHTHTHVSGAAPSGHRAYPANAYGAATSYGSQISPARAQALHECTAFEQKTSPTIRDSNLSMFEYRGCMNEHGQPE